jgi:hypothetical protein
MGRLITLATVALLLASTASAAPCRDAKGHFITCPSAAAAAPAAAAKSTEAAAAKPVHTVTRTASAAGGHPNCQKGKLCGNSCIAANKVCHK